MNLVKNIFTAALLMAAATAVALTYPPYEYYTGTTSGTPALNYTKVCEPGRSGEALVRQSIDVFLMEGRDYLQVAFGCYGGHHRSVYMAERCAERLAETPGIEVEVKHAARQHWRER